MFPNVFSENNAAFSLATLTDAINHIPYVPGRIGQLGLFAESGVSTLSIMIEQKDGVLSLVPRTPRGGPGTTFDKNKRNLRSLVIPHYQIDDTIMAEEVQGVRAFGTEFQTEQFEAKVNERMGEHVTQRLDPTLEFQRLGAVKGVILDADGSVLYDLFSEFGVTQEDEIDFDLDNANPVMGVLRAKCDGIHRQMADILGGIPFTGVHAIVGKNFWDDFIKHPEVRESYLYQEGRWFREKTVYKVFEFGGIMWEEYRGGVNNEPFVGADDVHMIPEGVPGLFKTVFAPADYIETVNTTGLPRYAKAIPMRNGKGVNLEVQSNALSYCTRPRVLLKGKRT